MSFRNKKLRGVEYDLSHLRAFEITVTPKAEAAPTFRVSVSFNSHVFTRDLAADDPPDLKYFDGREVRAFCVDRHALSIHLPNIIQNGTTGRAFFSEGRNFLLIEKMPGRVGPYAVFFNLERARTGPADAKMFVVSAYEKPNLPSRLPKITFATLVSKTVSGANITRPKK